MPVKWYNPSNSQTSGVAFSSLNAAASTGQASAKPADIGYTVAKTTAWTGVMRSGVNWVMDTGGSDDNCNNFGDLGTSLSCQTCADAYGDPYQCNCPATFDSRDINLGGSEPKWACDYNGTCGECWIQSSCASSLEVMCAFTW